MWPWTHRTVEDRERVAELAAHLQPVTDPEPGQVRDCGDARRDWPLNVVEARDPRDNRRPHRFRHPSEVGGARRGWLR